MSKSSLELWQIVVLGMLAGAVVFAAGGVSMWMVGTG